MCVLICVRRWRGSNDEQEHGSELLLCLRKKTKKNLDNPLAENKIFTRRSFSFKNCKENMFSLKRIIYIC